jgi:hypothetical protein
MRRIMSSSDGMQGALRLFLDWVASLLKSRRRLQAENLILRRQLNHSAFSRACYEWFRES